MNNKYINANEKDQLIRDVVIRQLKVHKDESGLLFETLRRDWPDVYGDGDMPFAMQYMSVTPSGQIRDREMWHVHQKQKDRFICAYGTIVTALYDARSNSPTFGKLNLFVQSPEKAEQMFMVVIPENVYHGFMVVSHEPGHLLNFPTQLYTGEDEVRQKNTLFNWDYLKDDFGL